MYPKRWFDVESEDKITIVAGMYIFTTDQDEIQHAQLLEEGELLRSVGYPYAYGPISPPEKIQPYKLPPDWMVYRDEIQSSLNISGSSIDIYRISLCNKENQNCKIDIQLPNEEDAYTVARAVCKVLPSSSYINERKRSDA